MLIKKIGILYHPMVKATFDKAEELTRFLNSRGIDVWIAQPGKSKKPSIS